MNSVRGVRSVRLQRTKTGLDFSVKGGSEHGIPIVISWILNTSLAAKQLCLGDEILSVNGQPLQGLSHTQAVDCLRQSGPTVVLRVKRNQQLEDVFSAKLLNSLGPAGAEQGRELPRAHSGPLPTGWREKTDVKTGRPYFQNDYTQTSGWTDPRSLSVKPLREYEWNKLPPGWERHLDQHGDIYYVCHDTQSTHWDSPRGLRQQRQMKELVPFLQEHKDKLKIEEGDLKEKRDLLLSKNQQLNSPTEGQKTEEENNSSTDLIDDIMLLNEEVEVQDAHISSSRRKLHGLSDILRQAQLEELRERDEHEASAEVAMELAVNFVKLKSLEEKLLKLVKTLGELQKRRDSTATPLHYMLQVPHPQSSAAVEEQEKWLHLLPDRLTAKTNIEMRLELLLLKECYSYGLTLQERLTAFYNKAMLAHGGWELLMEELAGCDFSPLQEGSLTAQFKEKLEKFIMF